MYPQRAELYQPDDQMTILKQEPELHPEDLFSSDLPWYVAHVRSRQEKAFARHLVEQGIGYYLPQCEKRIRRGVRNVVSFLPLFAGYVFFRASNGELTRAVRDRALAAILKPHDQTQIHTELRQLRDLQLSCGRLAPYLALEPGDAVLITEGVFAGYRGTVVKEKNEERLVVTVSFIRQSVSVELDRDCLERDRRASAAIA